MPGERIEREHLAPRAGQVKVGFARGRVDAIARYSQIVRRVLQQLIGVVAGVQMYVCVDAGDDVAHRWDLPSRLRTR